MYVDLELDPHPDDHFYLDGDTEDNLCGPLSCLPSEDFVTVFSTSPNPALLNLSDICALYDSHARKHKAEEDREKDKAECGTPCVWWDANSIMHQFVYKCRHWRYGCKKCLTDRINMIEDSLRRKLHDGKLYMINFCGPRSKEQAAEFIKAYGLTKNDFQSFPEVTQYTLVLTNEKRLEIGVDGGTVISNNPKHGEISVEDVDSRSLALTPSPRKLSGKLLDFKTPKKRQYVDPIAYETKSFNRTGITNAELGYITSQAAREVPMICAGPEPTQNEVQIVADERNAIIEQELTNILGTTPTSRTIHAAIETSAVVIDHTADVLEITYLNGRYTSHYAP